MVETELNPRPMRHYIVVLIYIMIMVGLGFVFVGPVIGIFAAMAVLGVGMTELLDIVSDPASDETAKYALYILQSCATGVGLIVVPAIVLRQYHLSIGRLFSYAKVEWRPVLLTVLVVVVFVGVNSAVAEWNAGMELPQSLETLEQWMRQREDEASEMVKAVTKMDTPWELFAVLLVVAVLPAVGEEVVFRGMVQNVLFRGTRNVHVAIWVAAALFSAIHLQFYGFLPRMLLGALFGYLYYWSGSLALAVIAHFVNNATSVIAVYYYQRGLMDTNLESPESLPLVFVLTSGVLTAGLLYYFYKYFEHRRSTFPEL